MKQFDVVTIITITYQAERVLRDTMESVLSQKTTQLEYVLVDGGSKDGTIEIIQHYEALFKARSIPFRWISEPDNGLYDAMNKGLRLATGAYVWFMNAGDTIACEDTLKTIIDSLESANLTNQPDEKELPDFIYGETMIVDEQRQLRGSRRLKAPERLTWKNFRMGMLVCHQSMIVKRSIAPEYNLSYRFSADFDWAIRCLRKSNHIYNTHIVLSHFLEGGLTNKKMSFSLKERFKIMSKNYGWLSTVLLHGWFIIRAGWFKWHHGWM
jgi:glycosyltransferase involved in cell wall biosynthesis